MQRYVSLLRGINVGGKLVDMTHLRQIFVSMGAANVQTYLRSGNVIFDSDEDDTDRLRSNIEGRLLKDLGFGVKVFLKTGLDIRHVVESMPYVGMDMDRMHVTFLSSAPASFPSKEVESSKALDEECSLVGSEIYLYCPSGYGRTRLSNNYFERKLKVDATTRNWRSVNALLKLAEATEQTGKGSR